MRKAFIGSLSALLAGNLYAAGTVQLSYADGMFTLDIPYVQFEQQAYAAQLRADSRLVFSLLNHTPVVLENVPNLPRLTLNQVGFLLTIPYLEYLYGSTRLAYGAQLQADGQFNFNVLNAVEVALATPDSGDKVTNLTLTSSSFSDGGAIPTKYACSFDGGSNLSPQLSWSNPPDGTAGYALVMDDEDAPCGTGANACKHWSVVNIPASVSSFGEGQNLSSPIVEGSNYRGDTGYAGPCPPNTHTYRITLYALKDSMPTLSKVTTNFTRSEFATTYVNHILGAVSLSGKYTPVNQ